MVKPMCSDNEFIELLEKFSFGQVAGKLGVSVRKVYERRANLEKRLSTRIARGRGPNLQPHHKYKSRVEFEVQNGVVLVGSDAHYWPGEITTAHRAFVDACKKLSPVAVVMNGDIFDGASISRHASIGWENRPTVIEELETCAKRLAEIRDASPDALHVWPLGNHDARFESRLANVAPEYVKVMGVHLKDHFPMWDGCWSCRINGNVAIKHRWKGGIHAAYNNAVQSGVSFVTGHLHKGVVTPFSDYNGTRYGVDLPTMADPYGPQFTDYTEDSPRNHRSGFAVLTFVDGKMLHPELVLVHDEDAGEVEFRGKIWKVS